MTLKEPDLSAWVEIWVDEVIADIPGEVMHIMPVDDLVGHERCKACICGPMIEHLGHRDFAAFHHALDGRE